MGKKSVETAKTSYEDALKKYGTDNRKEIVGDNPLDINDTQYGNNVLLTSDAALPRRIQGKDNSPIYSGMISPRIKREAKINNPEKEGRASHFKGSRQREERVQSTNRIKISASVIIRKAIMGETSSESTRVRV